MAKKDPISLLIVDLEKRSGGTFLLMEHLDRGKEMSLSRCIGLYYKLPKSDPYAVY